MKMVPIFAPHLYAFRYADETENEFDRLMEIWTDVHICAIMRKHIM